MSHRRVSHSLLAATLLGAALLSGCAPVVRRSDADMPVTTAPPTSTGAQIEDERIEIRGAGRLREQLGERVHINITSYNRQVLLTGEVPNEQDKQLAEQILARVENVRSVTNELAIMGPSTLGQRSSDALVTGRVKANLIDARDLNANAFKVVTERGVVYLMGRVTAREADRATDIARRTNGVQKVVRLFEVITEEELLEMVTPPADSRRTSQAGPRTTY